MRERFVRMSTATTDQEPLDPSPKHVHQITLYHRVHDWLREHAGNCYCDDCIAQAQEAPRKSVSIATRRLGTEAGFSKYNATCDSCGDQRAVTYGRRDQP